MLSIGPLTDMDLPELTCLQLKEADKEEVRASTGLLPNHALLKAVCVSSEVYKTTVGGRIIAVHGVSTLGSGIGVPWFLSSEESRSYPVAVARHAKRFINHLFHHSNYTVLMNFVWAQHEESIRLLSWLGFTISEQEFLMVDPSYRFRMFHMEA